MKNKIRLVSWPKPKGFTLTELAVGLGILSIIGLIISQMMVKQSENSSQITDFYEFNEFTIRIGDIIRNNRACENTLRGFTLPAAGALPLGQIRNADNNLIFDMANINDTTLSPRARVRSLQFNAFQNDVPSSLFSTEALLYRGQIEITFERGPLGDPKNPTYFRTIPLLVKSDATDPTKVFTCYNEENAWNAQLCQGLLSGKYTEKTAALQRMCEHINIKGSVSTDGHFCFNLITASPDKAGDIHQKDCINSWYGGWAQNFGGEGCYTEKTNAVCKPDFVTAGVTVSSCGKNCVKSEIFCCQMRLMKSL